MEHRKAPRNKNLVKALPSHSESGYFAYMGSKKFTDSCMRRIENNKSSTPKQKESPLSYQSNNPLKYLKLKKKLFLEQRSEETFHKQRLLDYKIHHFSLQDSKRLPALLVKHGSAQPEIKPPKLPEIPSTKHSTVSIRSEVKASSHSKTYANDNQFYIPIDNRVKTANLNLESEFRELMGVKTNKNPIVKHQTKQNDSVTEKSPETQGQKLKNCSSSKSNGSNDGKIDVSKKAKDKIIHKEKSKPQSKDDSRPVVVSGKKRLKKEPANRRVLGEEPQSDVKNSKNFNSEDPRNVPVELPINKDGKEKNKGRETSRKNSKSEPSSEQVPKNENNVGFEDAKPRKTEAEATEFKDAKTESCNTSVRNEVFPPQEEKSSPFQGVNKNETFVLEEQKPSKVGKTRTQDENENVKESSSEAYKETSTEAIEKSSEQTKGNCEQSEPSSKLLRRNDISNVSECTIIFQPHKSMPEGNDNGEMGKNYVEEWRDSINAGGATRLSHLDIDTTTSSSRITTPGPIRGKSACFPEC